MLRFTHNTQSLPNSTNQGPHLSWNLPQLHILFLNKGLTICAVHLYLPGTSPEITRLFSLLNEHYLNINVKIHVKYFKYLKILFSIEIKYLNIKLIIQINIV